MIRTPTANPTPRPERRAAPRAIDPWRAAAGGHALTPTGRVQVVVPVYNEARIIARTLEEVLAFAREHPAYRFIFVDDGSTDGTTELVRDRLDGVGAPASLVALDSNRGKGRAVRTGVERALRTLDLAGHGTHGRVCFIDGDLAYGLDHLDPLAAALESFDVVIGSRSLAPVERARISAPRRLMGGAFNAMARALIALPHRDTQAGLKGFRARAAREVFRRQRHDGFAFDAELIFLARRLGFSVGEVPARISPEHSYKASKVNLVRDPFRMLRALLDIRAAAARGRYD